MPTNPDLEWAIEDIRSRLPQYTLYTNYDKGDHRLLFATEKYRNTFGDLFREFADNLCEDVVDGITDRVQIDGWEAETDQALAAVMADLWTTNQGEARMGAVFRNGFCQGDGFVLAQEDGKGRARFYRQQPTQCAVRYSVEDPDEKEVTAKVWRDGRRYRANLYYADHMEKYGTKGLGADGGLPRAKSFEPLAAGDKALGDADTYAMAYDTVDGLGNPMFHFPNGELSTYGRSILRGVIPLQDALNKAIADMLVTMEYHAYPQRWATGVQVERDPVTGEEKSPFQAGEGRMFRVGSKDAALGQFDAASMDGFLDVQDSFKIEIARKGALPPHSITLRGSSGSNLPSGVALLVAEGKTIKLAKDRHRDWGTEARAMAAHVLSLQVGRYVDPAELKPTWAPPETRDELALLQMLLIKKDLGVPTRQLLLESGYEPDEVDDMLDDIQVATEANQASLSVLQGGRATVTAGQAGTLQNGLPTGTA